MSRALLGGVLFAVVSNVFAAPPISFDTGWRCPVSPVTACPAGYTCGTTVTGDGFIQRLGSADGKPFIETIVANDDSGGAIRMATSVASAAATHGPYAYFVNRDNNDVPVVDYSVSGTAKAEPLVLDAGLIPQGIAISPSGGYIYIGTGDGKILVIRAHDRQRMGEISLGSKPARLLMSHDGTRLYAVVEGGKSIIVIDTAARSVVKMIVLTDVSDRLAIHPDGTRLYSLSHANGNVYVIDAASGEVVKSHALSGQGAPEDIALDASGGRLYITLGHLATASTSLAVLNTATNDISFPDISFAGLPQALALNPVAAQLFVAIELPPAPGCAEVFGSVYVVDTNDMKLASILTIKGVLTDVIVSKSGWLLGMNKGTGHLELLDKYGQSLRRFPVAGLDSLLLGPELVAVITPGTKQLDFGEVSSGRPATRILTITNTGGLPLTVRGVRIEASNAPANIPAAAVASPSGFAVAGDSCTNKTLQPGDQCAITLSYAPASPGQSSALVHIDSDATLPDAPVAVTARAVSGAAEALPSSAGDNGAGGNSGGGGGSWGPASLMFAALWALVRRGRQRL